MDMLNARLVRVVADQLAYLRAADQHHGLARHTDEERARTVLAAIRIEQNKILCGQQSAGPADDSRVWAQSLWTS